MQNNRIYLDQDRTIQAQISSDASLQADQYSNKQKKITVKNLSTQFSLYIQQIKKELNRQLSSISRDFYNSIYLFFEEYSHAQKNRKNNLADAIRNWIPKLQIFEQKIGQLKANMPYLNGQKTKHKSTSSKKMKFTEVIEKFLTKLEMQNDTMSKVNLERQLIGTQNLYDNGRYQQAIVKAKQLLKSNTNPELFFLLGNCYKAMGYYKQAIHQYDKSIKISPKGCYFNNRGNCYLCLQDIMKAEHDYKKAIRQQPNNQVFLGNYGNVCLSLKKYEQAIISYNLALKAGQPNDFFYNNRAFAEIKLRRYDDAIESYNQAINLSPNNHVYFKNRANLFMEKGLVDKAISDINNAIQIEPNKHQYYFLKGKWEYFSKEIEKALVSFRIACKLEPNKKIYVDYYLAIRDQVTRR